MSTKSDTRYKSSEKKIQNAFWNMMKKEPFSEIRTQNIIKNAGINRSTFYAHYADKYDLLDKLENQLLDNFFNIPYSVDIKDMSILENTEEFHQYFITFSKYILNNKTKFSLLMSEQTKMVSKISNRIENLWHEKNINGESDVFNMYAISAISNLITGIIIKWISRDFQESPEEFACILQRLSEGIHIGVSGKITAL